jgi:hypothetical protein
MHTRVTFALGRFELERRVPLSREAYWKTIRDAISGSPREGNEPSCGASRDGGSCVRLYERKESMMKRSNRIWRGIACGGLSLALVSGMGLPISALAASSSTSESAGKTAQHREEFWATREKMLNQAKAEDATLEKLVAELNKAPEAKKADLEAAILTKLVGSTSPNVG